MIKKLGSALKKMSQRAMWRGDRSQSEAIENHGVFGMRSNFLNDTPSYKKEGVGLNASANNRNNNQNTKTPTTVNTQSNSADTKLGSNILDALK